ncbi:MAG: hypothetical protein HYW25_03765 [Candidatus Aenigmarchaeota archaeon]|nr:hypothetical protein [Candidatus Aenigmarchaeota archaeon]
MGKPKKNPWGFGVVKKIKLGGKWTTVIAPDKLITLEEGRERIRELQRKMRERNGNGD